MPLPLLYRVEPDGPITWFWMEYLGDDAAKAKLPVGMFRALKAEGVRKLVEFGVDESTISCHARNWVVAPGRKGLGPGLPRTGVTPGEPPAPPDSPPGPPRPGGNPGPRTGVTLARGDPGGVTPVRGSSGPRPFRPGRSGGQMAYCVDIGNTSLRRGRRSAAPAWRERS